MTKQQKTYLLLVAVLAVWGAIGYQFYSKLNPKADEVLEISSSEFRPKKFIKREQHEIVANYRDPFLGKLFTDKKKTKKKAIVKEQPKLPFPTIIFHGEVKGNATTSYILTINGRQEIIKIGKSVGNVTLIKANSKEAVVRFQKVSKTILRQ